MDTAQDNDELRDLVRRTLLEMLQQQSGTTLDPDLGEKPWRGQAPPERELRVTLRGSERSIGLLEEALANGDATLEVAVGSHWGPRTRVRAARS